MLHDPSGATSVDLDALLANGEAMQSEGSNMAAQRAADGGLRRPAASQPGIALMAMANHLTIYVK